MGQLFRSTRCLIISRRCLSIALVVLMFAKVARQDDRSESTDSTIGGTDISRETGAANGTSSSEKSPAPTTSSEASSEESTTKVSNKTTNTTDNEDSSTTDITANSTGIITDKPTDETESPTSNATTLTTEEVSAAETAVTNGTSVFPGTDYPDANNATLPSECSNKLGLEYGVGVFTASDWSPGFAPENARFNSHTGWIGGLAKVHYLQVDLERAWNVSGVQLQTHASWPTHYVKEFQILFSEDGIHWNKLRYDQDDSRFPTRFDNATGESFHVLQFPIQARYVVVNPTEWVGSPGPAMRMELYGCSVDASTVGNLHLRDVSGDVTINTTWEAGTPYRVSQMIQVWAGVTLRLEPGVEVYFADSHAGFRIQGDLIAEGTSERPIVFQSQELLSHLIAKPFWKGLKFTEGSSNSKVSYAKLSSAEIGIHATANAVRVRHVHFENCECGFRLEGGTQLEPRAIRSSSFSGNNFGIQFYNLSGIVEFSNLSFYDHKVTAISGNVQDASASTPGLVNVTVDDVRIEKSAYAVYLTSYKSSQIAFTDLRVDDCDYGVYLDLSDSVMSINTTISRSSFSRSRVYALLVDFKHFARGYRYSSLGDFRTAISDCSFDTGTTGLSYFSPESFHKYHSQIEITSSVFLNMQTAVNLNMFAQSSFLIEGCKLVNNTFKVVDIVYEGLVISGEVRNNTITRNDNAKAQESEPYDDRQKNSLFAITSTADSQCTLDIVGNEIKENTHHCIITTSLNELTMNWNVLDNPRADYELCVESVWVPGKSALNASFNWWGKPKLQDALARVHDFFHDLDLAMADVFPILREPRVVGSSWGNESHTLRDGSSNFSNGGVVALGNVTYSGDEAVAVSASIFVPKGTSLKITNAAFEFSNNTGILIEGSLIVDGQEHDSVKFDSQGNSSWKGLKFMNSELISLQNLHVANSRGVQSVGTTPSLNSVTVRDSYGPGLWIRTVQSSVISISNSTFTSNQIGLKFEIQGTSTTKLDLNITNCQLSHNRDFGIHLEGRYIMSNVYVSDNIMHDHSKSAIKCILSNGHVVVKANRLNVSYPLRGGDVKALDVEFVQPCNNNPARHVEILENTFGENNSSEASKFTAITINADCLTVPTVWRIDNNSFHKQHGQENSSFLELSTASKNSTYWPLDVTISNNSFNCDNSSISAFTFRVNHGENVDVRDNDFYRCKNPLYVEVRNIRQNTTVVGNNFVGNGQIVFRGASIDPQLFPFPLLNFSYNNVSDAGGPVAVNTSGYDVDLHYNLFDNPDGRYDLWVGDVAPVNATLNWWGTPEFNKILSRVLDGRTDFRRAEVALFPCLLSENYGNVSTPNPDVFQIMDGVIGGSVRGNVVLPPSDKPYTVKYPIRVPPGSSLTVPPGTTLLFANNTGIYSNGNLTIHGNKTSWINFKPTGDGGSWKGITVGQPRKEFAKVRLSGSSVATSGRVEVLVSETWLDVCSDRFGLAEGHVVCKELGFLEVDTTSSVTSSNNRFGMTDVKCVGMEMSIWDCAHKAEKYVGCESKKSTVVTCKNPTQPARNKREVTEEENTAVTMQYLNVTGADIGLQINHDYGINLDNVEVRSSRRPGMLLEAAGGIVNITQCVVAGGNDVGIDLRGSATVLVDSSNVTDNFKTAVKIDLPEAERTTLVNNCVISGNGGHGLNVSSKGNVLVSHSTVTKNRQSGAEIRASGVQFFRTLVEDHPLEGVNVETTGGINVTNSAFSNNGGVNVNISMRVGSNGSEGLTFTKSAFVNSSIYSTNQQTPHYAMYAAIDSPQNVSIPVTFSECYVLKAFDEAMLISAPDTELNLTVDRSHFEDIKGTIFQVVSTHPPQLNFKSNTMRLAKSNFLVVNSTV